MKKMRQHLVYFILLLVCYTSQQEFPDVDNNIGVLEAFRKIYPEILTAAKEGSNVLEKAKLISDRSAARANFLASIGQALFKGLEQIFDPDSDDLKEVRRLGGKTVDLFKVMEERIGAVTPTISEFQLTFTYEETIELGIDGLEDDFRSTFKDENKWAKERYTKDCTLKSGSPIAMLKWIEKFIVKNCQGSDLIPLTSSMYLRINNVFDELHQNNASSLLRSYSYRELQGIFSTETDRNEFVSKLTSLPNEKAHEIVGKMERVNEIIRGCLLVHNETCLNDQALFSAFTDFSWRVRTVKICYPRVVAEARKFRREDLLRFVDTVITDVERLELMASVCSFLAFNPEEQQIKFENVIQISKNITDTLRMYSEKLLESAWPGVVERNVKNLIGGGIEKAKYRQLANNIQKVADETGSNDYMHQTLVMEQWSEDKWFAHQCENRQRAKTCIVIQSFFEMNLIIARHQKTASRVESTRSLDYIDQKRADIKSLLNDNYDMESLTDLLNKVKSDYETDLNTDYNTIILVRKSCAFWIPEKECELTVEVDFTYISAKPGGTILEVHTNKQPVGANGRFFQLFFFI